MNLTNLEIFGEVYRAGSFSSVARQRNVSPSVISRAIATLEADLNVLLFYRTTRKIAPTDAAVILAEHVDQQIEALSTVRTKIADTANEVAGRLRVSASHSFGAQCLGPLLSDFARAYPRIQLDLILNDRIVDIVGERFDVAIRHGPLPDSSYIAKPLLRTRYYVCASPAWVKANGHPKSVEDIAALDCLTFPLPGFSTVWRFRSTNSAEKEVAIAGTLSANSGLVLRECALRGQGIVLLSDWIIGEDMRAGRLVDLFPEWIASPSNFQTAISAVYPNRSRTPKKVSEFVSFVQSKLSKDIPRSIHS